MKIINIMFKLQLSKNESIKFIDLSDKLGIKYLIRDIDTKYNEVVISSNYFNNLLEYMELHNEKR